MTSEKSLTSAPTKEEILARVEEDGIQFINLQFTDVMGIVKSVTIPSAVFEHVIDGGQWIDGSSIAGFTRIAESDMYLIPDLATYAELPWDRDTFPTARVICWVFNPNGDPFPGDPRAVLSRQLERIEKLGYRFMTGPELEFFLFQTSEGEILPLPHDRGSYFDFSTDPASTIRKDMVLTLAKMGIEVEASHHEVAIGQHEIGFQYGDALLTADRAVTFKYVLKAVAQQHGLHATFMPKPLEDIAGSGMHVHQSLPFDRNGQECLRRYQRSLWAFRARQAIHRRSVDACPRHVRGALAAGQFIPAAGAPASKRRSTSPGRAPTVPRSCACRPFGEGRWPPPGSSCAARTRPAIRISRLPSCWRPVWTVSRTI